MIQRRQRRVSKRAQDLKHDLLVTFFVVVAMFIFILWVKGSR